MQQIEKQFIEYYDALMTLEIAVRIAECDKRPVNRTIRDCWSAVSTRVSNKQNRAIFTGVCKQQFPLGALRMLRRQLDSVGEE